MTSPSADVSAPERTSARRAERGIALVAPAMRGVVLLQIVLSTASGVRLSDHPSAYAALTGAVVVVSVTLVAQCLLSGTVRTGVWRYPDLTLAWLAIPAMNLLLPTSHVVGTWESWAPGYAINVAALAATWMRPAVAVTHALALGGWLLVWTSAVDVASWETSLGNALTIPGYAIVVALLAHYLRELAADADQSREDAVAATRALELQRYQLTVHDASSILRLLSDEETPAAVLPGLRVQADREARRLRNYLSSQLQQPSDRTRCTVGTMLAAALEGFDDLPLELAVELGAHVELSEDVWTASRGAVAAVLHNARMHAAAHQVVVHADTDGATWEVVVSDDGVGFDQENQTLGFGLDTQVCDALAGCGVAAEILSSPGRGTSVTIVGRVGRGEDAP
ncbi:hypothetical protein FE697_020440 [Mumia zhuanghuii]|uniref:Signal transduction histidine kinase n=2 Tax=Mumia TaxID=1546255 RepID=A0ABW1QJ92_9ACTN|nr:MULTISPECIES: hypothetical protein [Mumia]KAA1418203.1 hypothetical protein FE697_020440 [Mumia zhuanghuii]